MIDLALYSHAVSSFTQALYLRYFLEEPGHFPFQGAPIFLLGHRKPAEVCGDPFASSWKAYLLQDASKTFIHGGVKYTKR